MQMDQFPPLASFFPEKEGNQVGLILEAVCRQGVNENSQTATLGSSEGQVPLW